MLIVPNIFCAVRCKISKLERVSKTKNAKRNFTEDHCTESVFFVTFLQKKVSLPGKALKVHKPSEFRTPKL